MRTRSRSWSRKCGNNKHKESFFQDLSQTQKINKFSKESQDLVAAVVVPNTDLLKDKECTTRRNKCCKKLVKKKARTPTQRYLHGWYASESYRTSLSSTPCIDDHHFKEEEEMNSVERIVYWKVSYWWTWYFVVRKQTCLCSHKNELKLVTNVLARLISYIHHTCNYRQYCHVGNTGKQCRLGLFQDSDFAGDLEDSKSTSGGTLCIFGSHTFVPISWMCKKQTSVSHSSTESRNHLFGRRIEIRRYARFWLVGSDRYCSWRKDESRVNKYRETSLHL